MRGTDSYSENLFSTTRLEDFMPASHPLRAIRAWMNDTLAKMDEKFSAMHEDDTRGGRPSTAPEELMRAMLLQVLFRVRSERQLVQQVNYNLLFRWFVGLSIDDPVWNHSVFCKNRDRLIKHEALIDLFHATVTMAEQRGLLTGEHFSVDGTLLKSWVSHKGMWPKDGSDDGRPPEDWRGEPRSNDTHESSSDGESRLYRKSNAAPAQPSYFGHVLSANRHGLAEREVAAQMLTDLASKTQRKTVAADKANDTKGFVKACRELNVTPHVAQNVNRLGGSAIDVHTTRHEGYTTSMRARKRIEQCFGWGKTVGPLAQVMVRGLDKVDQFLPLTMAAYSPTRLRALAELRLLVAQ